MCKATRPPSGMRARETRFFFGDPSAALRTAFLAAFGPSAKSVGRPLFLSYQFSPTFSHSPPSALGGRAEAAKLVPGGSSTALGNESARSAPLQKVSANPYFYHTSFPPLFPTLRPRRSGAVLGARGSVSAARAPRSGTNRRAPHLCKKCRQTPIFIVPVFPHFSPYYTPCHSPGCVGRSAPVRFRRCGRGPRKCGVWGASAPRSWAATCFSPLPS